MQCGTIYNLRVKMEEIANSYLEKIPTRRSRKDQEGRDFQCGCGKRYLSYPALYTHIKTKHEGRQPEGTLKVGLSQVVKRSKGKIDEETLRSVHSCFFRDELRIFAEQEQALFGSVSLNRRIKKDLVPKEVYEAYLNLLKHQQARLSKNSSLESALVVYLINMGEYLSEKVYEQLLFMAKIARNSYHEHGEQVFKALFTRRDRAPFDLTSFSTSEVKYFPIICEFLIQCYIPVTFEKQIKEINISLMELLLLDFCSWLYLRKLTPILTSLSKQFKLDYKPPAQKPKPNKADPLHSMNELDNKQDNDDDSEQLSDNQNENDIENEIENENENENENQNEEIEEDEQEDILRKSSQ